MYDVTIFGINLTLDPVAFTLPIGDGWPIYWYGIIIALGFLLAIIYGMKNAGGGYTLYTNGSANATAKFRTLKLLLEFLNTDLDY